VNVKKVLFLCTGNYYRSRFAEDLFNHLAPQSSLAWRADSRGLAVGRTKTLNVGPISTYALNALKQRSITVPQPIRYPKMASSQDFASAHQIIAMKEAEHRALMGQHFADWADRITYWNVDDVDQAPPELALGEVETLVRSLIARLRVCTS